VAVIKIDGDASGALRSISQIESALGGIQRSASTVTRSLGGLQSALGAIAGIAVGGSITKQLYDITVAAQEMTNKLIFATGSVDAANKTFGLLANTAQATGSSLAGTIDLFSKLAQSSTFAGSSNEALAKITENFNKTLQISGASGAGAAAALYQFAQAMQKGTLNGDEFRTIMETNGYLMKVLEKQTGLTRTELISMASDGRLSAEMLGKALIDADMITQDYGKTIRTIPQAFENLNTALTVAVKNFDSVFGISDAFVRVLDLMSKNIGVVIGAIGGIAVATAALLIPLIPAATAMAVLTGGAAVLGAAALGAAIGYAAQQAGVFGKDTEKAVKSQTQLTEEAKKGLVVNHQRNMQALDLDKGLRQTIDQLKAQNVIEAQQNGIRNIGLEVEKAVAKEREKYKKTGEAIPPALERELALETRKKLLIEESLKTKQKILELESAIYVEGIKDAGQRQIAGQLESYRLSVSKETYEANKNTLSALIQKNIQTKALNDYTNELKSSQIEITALTIKDLDVREQTIAVEKERLKYGSLFTTEMEKAVRANVQNNQALREAVALEQQRALASGSALPQGRAEQITTATGAMSRLDPSLSAQQQYMTEKAALENSEVLAADQKNQLLQKLEYEHQQKMNEIRLNAFEANLKMAGVTDATILNVAKTTMQQSQMVVQGGIVGIQGGLSMLGGFLEQAGKNNKKAFEAQKAVAIAQTIISTYQAATQAFAAMSLIPFIGPALGFAAAATIVAAGMANVAAIKNQQYSGRQLGGPVMGGKSYMVGENGPELFTPNTTGSITRNQDLGSSSPTNINFTIIANDTQGFDQLLSSRKGVIQQIISDAMLERGQRSIV
jgi:tape measure domain-containing protein